MNDATSMNTVRDPFDGDIPIGQLKPYSKHPFRAATGAEYDELFESIKTYGVRDPIIARFTSEADDVYEIVSGHTRVKIAKKLGLASVPAKVMTMDDDEAAIMVVELNYRRKTMYPSDMGRAFKLRLDALNRQGQRSGESSSGQSEQKSSRDKVASMYGVSGSKVHRLIRLAELIPAFQATVDKKKMLLSVAENISYLNRSEQKTLHHLIKDKPGELTRQQSAALKKERKRIEKDAPLTSLDESQIEEILNTESESKTTGQSKPISKKIFFETIAEHELFKDKNKSSNDMLELVMQLLNSHSD